ncbi:Uncharacterised protein [Bordetella pertussis]|nr:Uncharacterised protein [Bordetella pertussis]
MAGVGRLPTVSRKRCHSASAALTEICWPMMARASVTNGEPREVSQVSPCRPSIRA